MELAAAVRGRRSIRKFKPQDVPEKYHYGDFGDGALVAVLGKYAALDFICVNR